MGVCWAGMYYKADAMRIGGGCLGPSQSRASSLDGATSIDVHNGRRDFVFGVKLPERYSCENIPRLAENLSERQDLRLDQCLITIET